jgi:hypothetical protein
MKHGILIFTLNSLVNPDICDPLVIEAGVCMPVMTGTHSGKIIHFCEFYMHKIISKTVVDHIILGSELETREFGGFNGDKTYEFSEVRLVTENHNHLLEYSFKNNMNDVVTVRWRAELIQVL